LDDYENNEIKLLMGHLSMLTDLRLTEDERFLITSDRDEKIRISHWMNSYNIKSFLLGHKEFVTQVELVDGKRLLSCSGDAKLILWDLEANRPEQVISTLEFLKAESGEFVSKGIDKFDFDKENGRVVVHLYK
jgi:WD40 repeat protein